MTPSLQSQPAPTRVAISILNWNGAAKTQRCLQAVAALVQQSSPAVAFTVDVLDNGSAEGDWQLLQTVATESDCPSLRLSRESRNLGFAGGHNRLIARALEEGADFIWVLNNDALPEPHCVDAMLQIMASDSQCGIVTPVIVAEHDPKAIDFAGGVHRWSDFSALRTESITEGRAMEAGHRQDCWLVGTAVLLRAAAVREAGLFETSYFAYFEDNELAVRFARHGYVSRMAFDARVLHFTPWQMEEQRASYFFYLMARNEMRFWVDNTPNAWRRPVRYRVVQRAFTRAWRLRQHGQRAKADACLLGAWDGILKRGGPPVLDRPVPALMALIYAVAIARGAPK